MSDYDDELTSPEVMSDLHQSGAFIQGGAFISPGDLSRIVADTAAQTQVKIPPPDKNNPWVRAQMDLLYGRNRDGPWPPRKAVEQWMLPSCPPELLGRPDSPTMQMNQAGTSIVLPSAPAPRRVQVEERVLPSLPAIPPGATWVPGPHLPQRGGTPPAMPPERTVQAAARRVPPQNTPTAPLTAQEIFRREFRRENPGANDGDADVAWGAALRCSTLDIS